MIFKKLGKRLVRLDAACGSDRVRVGCGVPYEGSLNNDRQYGAKWRAPQILGVRVKLAESMDP